MSQSLSTLENQQSAILTSTERRPSAPNPHGGSPGKGWKKSTMRAILRKDWLVLIFNGQEVLSEDFRLFPMDEPKDIDFTWHHNVPWEDLRKAWNIIATFCRAETVLHGSEGQAQ